MDNVPPSPISIMVAPHCVERTLRRRILPFPQKAESRNVVDVQHAHHKGLWFSQSLAGEP